MVWPGRPHAAFTGLTRVDGRWFCAFREGQTHSTLDGRIRVITSVDGVSWESAAEFVSPFAELPDLRDGKIVRAPDGDLLLMAAAAFRDGAVGSVHRTLVWRSADGVTWGDPTPISGQDRWVWGVGTDGVDLLAASYGTGGSAHGVQLHRWPDFSSIATLCDDQQRPNETAVAVADGRAVALIRRELRAAGSTERHGSALLGTASTPYTEWTFHDTGVSVGGPALIILPDGSVVAGGRKQVPQPHTSLWQADTVAGELRELRELITLPSAGDTSYPGMVWCDDRLWVSYYSSHEGPTSIYFAELELQR
jgi:hypothetical protein